MPSLIAAAIVVAPSVALGSMPESLIQAVPKDAVASYFAAGSDSDASHGGAASSLGLAAFVIEHAQDFGLLSALSKRTRIWVDEFAAISELLDYPHAGVLLDFRAAPRPDGGHQLAGLHAALILRTDGANTRIELRIQHLLSSYTNSENSTLSRRERDGAAVFTLRDGRLPDWVELTWGAVGDHYIVAMGAGSFERIVATMADRMLSLADDAWFSKAWETAGGPAASLAGQIRFDAARAAADDLLVSKIERVQETLLLSGIDRGLWTLGRRGRAIAAGAFLRRSDRDEWAPITRDGDAGLPPGVIPDEATWYIVLDVEPRALINTVSKAYLSTKSPDAERKSREFWERLQERADVSIDVDILAHLREPIVIHDYPQHALRLPFAWTRVIPLDDAAAVRRNLDRVLDAARVELAKEASIQLRRDADGVWYLYFGIAGPAVAVADDRLIISFSPDAVRKNIDSLARSRSGSAATLVTSPSAP